MYINLSKLNSLIWKINGVIILLASVLAIVGISVLIYTSMFRNDSEKGIKVLDNKKEEFLKFDEFTRLNKTSFLMSNLSASQTKFGSFSSYDYDNLRNVLLFNFESQKSQWIFKDNNNYISRNHVYIHEDESDDCCDRTEALKSKTVGIFFTYANKDTNGDEKIDKSDKLNLIHRSLLNDKVVFVLLDADSILGIKRITKNELMIFFTKDLKSYFRKYNFVSSEISIASPF